MKKQSRRRFLSGSGALVTSALLAGEGDAEAQQRPAVRSVTRLIDVHHHFLPPLYTKIAQDQGAQTTPWTPQVSLKKMDQCGLATAMLSMSNWAGRSEPDAATLLKLCRDCNEYGAKMVADYPGRFGLFASLMTLPDVDATLKELAYAMDALHADGVGLMSHYGQGKYLGDPSFAPLFEELNRRKAVAFIHPTTPWYEFRWERREPPIKFTGSGIAELPFDTTRAVISMLGEGYPDRYPNIKFILPHCGGTVAFLLSRVALLGSRSQGFKMGDYTRLAKAMSTFYYDLTNTVEPPSIKAVLAVAPAARLLFGTDIPRGEGSPNVGDGNEFVHKMIAELPKVGLSAADLSGVARRNAEALFPRLKQTTSA
jgi:predicted TIM-barrel fold metal-dependent hydrolase